MCFDVCCLVYDKQEVGEISTSVFPSGRLVIAGARSEMHANLAAQNVMAKLNASMHRTDLRVYNFTVQNIVCSCDLGFPLNLYVMDVYDKPNVTFQPESFEGLHWRTKEAGFMLFSSGKVVATGMKKMSQIPAAAKKLEELHRYRLGHEQVPESVLVEALNNRNRRFDRKRDRDLELARAPRPPVENPAVVARQRTLYEFFLASQTVPYEPLFPQVELATPELYQSRRLVEELNTAVDRLPVLRIWTDNDNDDMLDRDDGEREP